MRSELQLEESSSEQENRDSDPLLEKFDKIVDANSSDDDARSSEIRKDDGSDDPEAGSSPCCRICLECDGDDDDELISPCMCKGTQQFVHRSCLDHWRSVKEGFAFLHCTTCKAQFHLRVELFEDNSWRKLKFRLFVARDVILVFFVVQTVRAIFWTLPCFQVVTC